MKKWKDIADHKAACPRLRPLNTLSTPMADKTPTETHLMHNVIPS